MRFVASRSRAALTCATVVGLALVLAWPTPPISSAREVVSVADASRARPIQELPSPYRYVVPPTRISPDAGVVSGDKPAFFREPHLLVNELGMVAVFMETPPGNPLGRLGWSCSSRHGREWECGTISTIGSRQQFHDFADPWLADTRGDPCPTYGSGITLAALERTGPPTAEGLLAGANPARTVAYYSTDMGRTWQGPETIPEPAMDIGPDGSKVTFTGRTYIGYRSFIQTGIYVSRLGTDADPCAFSEALELPEANDHPRLTSTAEAGGLAIRGVTPGTVAGGTALTFNRFGPDFETQLRDVPVTAVLSPTNLIPAFCTSDGTCRTGTDVGQTLLYDPVRDRYHHVYSDRPIPTEGNLLEDLVTRYNYSDDGGLTWSVPVKVAGSGSEFSEVGASSIEPTLAWDPVRETVLLAYYEKPTKDSLRVEMRVRVLGENGAFSPPITVDETGYVAYSSSNDDLPNRPVNGEREDRFGDYFGFQACDGVFHIAHHPLAEDGTGEIAYLAVRYAEPSRPPAFAGPTPECPRVTGGPGRQS